MFNFLRRKISDAENIEEKKYKNIYELAKGNSEEFESKHGYSKFTKSVIYRIEGDIARLSKQGVRVLTYHTEDFNARADMREVKKYFKDMGFSIAEFRYFPFQHGLSSPVQCLSAEIRW